MPEGIWNLEADSFCLGPWLNLLTTKVLVDRFSKRARMLATKALVDWIDHAKKEIFIPYQRRASHYGGHLGPRLRDGG